jgi:D-alanyl-D-alanine carboxypeptidase
MRKHLGNSIQQLLEQQGRSPFLPTRRFPIALVVLILVSVTSCRNWTTGSSAISKNSASPKLSAAIAPKSKPLFSKSIALKLQRVVEDAVRYRELPGAVLHLATSQPETTATSSQYQWAGAAGQADKENKLSLKRGDRFRIGSLTKIFVAVVCLQLTEEGTLNLDKSIANWLPSDIIDQLPNGKTITIRQLLNHTSGIPDPYGSEFQDAVKANPTQIWTMQQVLNYAYVREASPQGQFAYSNANYLLLQLIIEKATEQSLATVLYQRIGQPLGLKDTFLELHDPIPGGFVQGYEDWDGDRQLDNVLQPLINDGLGFGDNGLVSSAPDLQRFSQAIFQGDQLLTAASRQEMLKLAGRETRGSYGLGIDHFSTPWGEAWGHSGQAMGFTSILLYFPVHDLTLIAWTNEAETRDITVEIAEEALEVIFGDR